uniref:bifunctional aspartokinase/homoserine dehydrogenase 2, chloroplastic isoform X3 n=1 Tax=Fragaria vesca subsp. vesca TaxID=101020 RepID=UPI0005C84DEB|nr:PREDICTED: bifunctional aspartokinase/homoserine dehydrogenase 2, chloroplastic isoform X3 [Fragaria vesca subsp. vesca]
MKKVIPLILMGCGGVGRQLLQHIVSCRPLHAKQGIHLRVVGVSDSKSLVVASSMELSDNSLLQLCRIKSDGSSLQTLAASGQVDVFTNPESIKKITDIAALLGKSTGLALVDCSASSETIPLLTQAVDLGCCIVMANKKPLTSAMEDYDKLISRPRHIRHESTVGAGLPVISSLHRVLSSGDPVRRIIGSLSGTLGYVMSEVEDGKPIGEVVRSAKNLGYTEPDPRDDLSGMDVARKALILARLLGWRINLDDIKIQSLYPKEMAPGIMSVEEFLGSGLQLLDKGIKERVSMASLSGNVLRYVCVIEASRWRFTVDVIMTNHWSFKELELAMILPLLES